MNELEKASAPLLTPLILDQGAQTLDASAQASIATWTVKTAMMLIQASTGRKAIPAEHHRELFRRQQPPSSTQIWLGRYVSEQPLAQFFSQPLAAPKAPGLRLPASAEGYGVTLSIGHLVMQAFGHTLGAFSVGIQQQGFTSHLAQIWPPSIAVRWPPPLGFDEASYAVLERAFGN